MIYFFMVEYCEATLCGIFGQLVYISAIASICYSYGHMLPPCRICCHLNTTTFECELNIWGVGLATMTQILLTESIKQHMCTHAPQLPQDSLRLHVWACSSTAHKCRLELATMSCQLVSSLEARIAQVLPNWFHHQYYEWMFPCHQ